MVEMERRSWIQEFDAIISGIRSTSSGSVFRHPLNSLILHANSPAEYQNFFIALAEISSTWELPSEDVFVQPQSTCLFELAIDCSRDSSAAKSYGND